MGGGRDHFCKDVLAFHAENALLGIPYGLTLGSLDVIYSNCHPMSLLHGLLPMLEHFLLFNSVYILTKHLILSI